MTILEQHIIQSLPMLSAKAKEEASKVLGGGVVKKRVKKFENMNLNRKY